jgi:predicted nucleotidyltransferase
VSARTGSPGLAPIFRSELSARLLDRLLSEPQKAAAVTELAEDLSVTPQAVRRELRRFVDAGWVVHEGGARSGRFRADTNAPVYGALRELLEKTVGIEAQLRNALTNVEGVRSAAIYGSWATGRIRSDSDVDVLVIGDVDYAHLVERIADVHDRSGRDINLMAMRPDEFRDKLLSGSAFLKTVVGGPRIPLVGQLTLD